MSKELLNFLTQMAGEIYALKKVVLTSPELLEKFRQEKLNMEPVTEDILQNVLKEMKKEL